MNGMVKYDPYNHEGLYTNWKKNPTNTNISKENNKIIQEYVIDMEEGKNISRLSKKGGRSFIRLNKARQKISYLAELLEKHFEVFDISKVSEDTLQSLLNNMRNGKIRKMNGEIYKSVGDYAKVFKAFWHWFQKVNEKKGKLISDITTDLDTSYAGNEELPEFVFFTEEQLNEMLRVADEDMKAVMIFQFDSGMRVTEMKNIKPSDFLNNFKEVNVRGETSKTFGRRFKLMLSSEIIKNYIQNLQIERDNFVFKLNTTTMNERLNAIGKKVLNNPKLTLYDFRHSSACYWYPRYPNIQGLLYRFGWKSLKQAHYYARFLGMEDTITEENLLLGVTKTELEKKINQQQQQINKLMELWKADSEIDMLQIKHIETKKLSKEEKIKMDELYDKKLSAQEEILEMIP